MNVAAQVARRNFSAKTLRSLSRKGIEVIGTQLLPNMKSDLPWADPDLGIVVADNGTSRVWTFSQVLEAV
jgi:hypothetical protein